MRMRLNKTERVKWHEVTDNPDIDTDLNELESSGTISFAAKGKASLTAEKRAIYMLEGYSSSMFGEGDFEITYDFSTKIRNNRFKSVANGNVKYGEDRWTFRLLYEWLCVEYNGGEYFIDTYFEDFFPQSQAYNTYLRIKESLQSGLDADIKGMRKAGPGSMEARGARGALRRFAEAVSGVLRRFVEAVSGRRLKDTKGRFASVTSPDPVVDAHTAQALGGGWAKLLSGRRRSVENDMRMLSEEIRLDIIRNLRAGNLTRAVADSTKSKRRRIPVMANEEALFYASGQLINDMRIYVQLDSGGWEERQAPQMGVTRSHGGHVVGGRTWAK